MELPELEVLLEVPCWVHTGILDNMSSNNLIVWWELILTSWSLEEHGDEWIGLGEGILTLGQVGVLDVDSDGLRVVINALPCHENRWVGRFWGIANITESISFVGVDIMVSGSKLLSLEYLLEIGLSEIIVGLVVNAHICVRFTSAFLWGERGLGHLVAAEVLNVLNPDWVMLVKMGRVSSIRSP